MTPTQKQIDELVSAATPFANLDYTDDRYLRRHGNVEMSFKATAFQIFKLRQTLAPFIKQEEAP